MDGTQPEDTQAQSDHSLRSTWQADQQSLPISIEYYTDPLCSWCWAFEPQWRHVRYVYRDILTWRYRMGGLIENWASYNDAVNDVRTPQQMGPHWYYISQITGMPLDERIWRTDPPTSSMPACLAVKAAQRQGADVAEHYLRRLREAVMLEQRNIALSDVLIDLAGTVSPSATGHALDIAQFTADLHAPESQAALREDLRDAAYLGINRLPSLIVSGGGRKIVLTGYRPFTNMVQAIQHLLAGEAVPAFPTPTVATYTAYWGRVLPVEVAEGCQLDTAATTHDLNCLADAVQLARVPLSDRPGATLYAPVGVPVVTPEECDTLGAITVR